AVAGDGEEDSCSNRTVALGEQNGQRRSERMSDDCNAPRVNVRERAQETKSCESIRELVGLEQLQLHPIAFLLACCGQRRIHAIDTRYALSRREAIAPSEQIEKDVTMLREHRP